MSIIDERATTLLTRVAFSPPPRSAFSLVVESGPDRGLAARVDGSAATEIIIGGSPVSPLRITDPTVSRRHFAVDVVAAGLRLRDLGSKNGTYVGSLRVNEALLAGGEAIVIGDTVLRASVEQGPLPTTALPLEDRFGRLIGASREMRRLFPLLGRLATTTIPILIEGETGTGKELVAEAVHAAGPRGDREFVLCDCTAINSELIESELFGHEKGAFTGATTQRKGVFEQADGTTLFIDELGELSLDLQAKLLRAIDTGQIRRVGGQRWIQCDVRVIVATRRDLDAMVQVGTFRDDLYHRLAVGRVALPPLRDRKGDVPLLVDYFCTALGGSPSVLPRTRIEEWLVHPWPGNVRELRNAVARELALGELALPPPASTRVRRGDGLRAGAELDALLADTLTYDEARRQALDLFQRHYVERMMQQSGGNVQRASEMAGVALRYFQVLRARFRRDP